MARASEQNWTRVSAALQGAGALGEAAEIHGEFCGLACVMGQDVADSWVNTTLTGAGSRPADVVSTLDDLAAATWAALDTGDMSFFLLLPPDSESLELRVDSLGVWCQGFMHGLGAAGQAGKGSPLVQHDEIREIVKDFSEITRASFSAEETEDEGEAAYMELVEYVRVSAQLIFEELHTIRSGSTRSGPH